MPGDGLCVLLRKRSLKVASYASLGVDCRRLPSATPNYGAGGVVQTEPHGSGLAAFVAILRFLGSSCLKKAVLLAASICVVGGERVLAQDAQGQPARRTFGDARDCPPGHRIEFVLPATTIYVDPRWLGSMTIGDLKDRGGPACPTGPVKLVSVEFSKKILDALDLHHGIGTRLFRLDVGGNPNDPQSLTPERKDSDKKQHHSAPWIEDNTIKSMLTRSPNTRGYRLYYPIAKGVPNRPVTIACGGGGTIPGTSAKILRTCAKGAIAGRGTPVDGVHYDYTLSQTDGPIPDVSPEYSTDPSSEPGALLEFDSRFRAWFLTLTKKP